MSTFKTIYKTATSKRGKKRAVKSRKISGYGSVVTGKVKKALKSSGPGQTKRIFKSAKKAFDVGDNKTAKALWAVGKSRIKFLKKVHK